MAQSATQQLVICQISWCCDSGHLTYGMRRLIYVIKNNHSYVLYAYVTHMKNACVPKSRKV